MLLVRIAAVRDRIGHVLALPAAEAHDLHLVAVAAGDGVDLELGVGAGRRGGVVLGKPLLGGGALGGVEARVFEFHPWGSLFGLSSSLAACRWRRSVSFSRRSLSSSSRNSSI